MIDPLGLRTSYAYDAWSNLIRTVNPLGQINTSVFDLANRLVAQIDPLLNRTSYCVRRGLEPGPDDEPAGPDHDQRFRHDEPACGHRRSAFEPHQFQL